MYDQNAIDRAKLVAKWSPVLEHADYDSIRGRDRREVMAVLLENQCRDTNSKSFNPSALSMLTESAPANSVGSYSDTGGFAKFDPVLMSLVRRSMPKLMAFDVCGVQPMSQPTGLIFAMKSRYGTQGGTEALFNEADTDYSGTGTHAGANPVSGTYTTGSGMTTADGERLGQGGSGDGAFAQMAFSIEKVSVTAKTRKLKSEYSLEIAQDMQSIHGLNAEAELANILSTEILSEINREVIRNIYVSAKPGAQVNTATAGTFDLDVDSNGRWLAEKFKGLMYQIDREANAIFHQTRMGRGNFIICSADVASALAMAGKLDYAPALDSSLNVDESSSTFAGILNGRYKVFLDPYSSNISANQFCVVGYKGDTPYKAGLYYCPYVPLQMLRANDPNSFQPKIAFQTRYALAANPFVDLDDSSGQTGDITANANYYFRRIRITNLM